MGRRKKLEKGIDSLEKQIEIHKEKLKTAGTPELRKYWEKEIEKFQNEIAKKKTQLTK